MAKDNGKPKVGVRHPHAVQMIVARRLRRSKVIKDYRRGITLQRELAARHGVSLTTIARDLEWARWQLHRTDMKWLRESIDALVERQMEIYREAMDAWERSKQEAIKTEMSADEGDGDGKKARKRVKRTTEQKHGAAEYLTRASAALAEIRSLMGYGKIPGEDGQGTTNIGSVNIMLTGLPDDQLDKLIEAKRLVAGLIPSNGQVIEHVASSNGKHEGNGHA